MQYQPESEKVAMTGTAYAPVMQPLSLANDPQIQRTRKTFIIILGVGLGLTLIGLIAGIFGSGIGNTNVDARVGSQIAQSLLGILIYGLGILAAYKYSPLGLRIFAWFGIVGLVLMGIGIVFLLFAIIGLVAMGATVSGVSADPEMKGNASAGTAVMIGASVGIIIFLLILIAFFVLSVIVVKLAFKLARLIDANKRVINPQI